MPHETNYRRHINPRRVGLGLFGKVLRRSFSCLIYIYFLEAYISPVRFIVDWPAARRSPVVSVSARRGAGIRVMACRTRLSRADSVKGLARMSKDEAPTPWESRIGWAYPDMKRAGTSGRMAPIRAATSLPSIPGMTTSVRRRVIG